MKKNYLISIPLVCAVIVAGTIPFLSSKTIINTPNVSSQLGPLVEEAIKGLKTPNVKAPEAQNGSGELWSRIVNANEWLKAQRHWDRDDFIINFVQSLATNGSLQRQSNVQNWLKEESLRIKKSLSSPQLIEEWESVVLSISSHLNELGQNERGRENSSANSLEANKKIIATLQRIKSELASYKGETHEVEGMNANLLLFLILSLGGFCSYLISRIPMKDESDRPRLNETNNTVKVLDLVPTEKSRDGLDFEEICHNGINNLKFLFNSSGVPIHNLPKEPHPYRLNGNKEQISNAVEALVRGSLSLVQNQKDYSSLSLQWSCKMTEERAYFDIEILGKKITEEDLRENHLLLEANSLVSQFGRAEKNLENYRPAIQIIPQENKTKITLSLETSHVGLNNSVH